MAIGWLCTQEPQKRTLRQDQSDTVLPGPASQHFFFLICVELGVAEAGSSGLDDSLPSQNQERVLVETRPLRGAPDASWSKTAIESASEQ